MQVETDNSYKFSLAGLMPHKKRKHFPYYGRKKRATTQQRQTVGWTLLDPNTGRPLE